MHLKLAVDGSGACYFEGIPLELEKPIENFTDEEKRTNPLAVLQAAIREREQLSDERNFEESTDLASLPKEFDVKKML